MELRHLRHFVAIADARHVGRAAQDLGMAQPPLSQSLARLEAELGLRLFDRGARRMTLTPAGQAFLEDARQALAHAERAKRLAQAASEGEAGTLRLGFVSAALYDRLPAALRALKQRYPAVRVELHELGTNEQLDALEAGALDLGFLHPPLGRVADLDLRTFPPDPMIAVLPDRGHRTERVTLAELAQLGLILFPQANGPRLHAAILQLFTDADLTVEIVQEAARTLSILSLVAAGLGASLLPRPVQRVAFRGVRYAELDLGDRSEAAGREVPTLSLALAARRRPRPAAVDRFLALSF